jgi:hypothetical protein
MVKKVKLDLYINAPTKMRNVMEEAPYEEIDLSWLEKRPYRKVGETVEETVRIENPEYFEIKDQYLALVSPFRENTTDEFIGGMPVALEKNCLKQLLRTKNNEPVYGMTLKADGERYLMFLATNGFIYFIDRSMNFYYFVNDNGTRHRINPDIVKPFILDGELMEYREQSIVTDYEYLVFDVLFAQPYRGKETVSWMHLDYIVRYNTLRTLVDDLLHPFYSSAITDHRFHCSVKLWFPLFDITNSINIYKEIIKKTNETRSKKYRLKADGVILQPFDGAYIPFKEWNAYNNVQFKWKPSDELTVDFKIRQTGPSTWTLYTKTDQVYNVSQKKGKPQPAICYPTRANMRDYTDGDVGEFILQPTNNPQGNIFQVRRKRPEKSANSYNTIMSTLDVISNPFDLDILKPALIAVVKPDPNNEELKNALMQFSKSQLILFSVPDFFVPKERSELEKVYRTFLTNYRKKTPGNNVELEVRIFKRGKKGNILDKFTFYHLYNFLKWNFPMQRTETADIILNNPQDIRRFRSTYTHLDFIMSGESMENMAKKSLTNFVFFPTDKDQKLYNNLVFKLDVSDEMQIDKVIGLPGTPSKTTTIRVKDRHTFKINNNWKIDLTKVWTSFDIKDVMTKNETYELECEYLGGDLPFADFIKSLSDLYKILLSNSSYC